MNIRHLKRMILLISLSFCSIVAGLYADGEVQPQCAQSCIHFICLLQGVPISINEICQIIPPKEGGESLLEIKQAIEYIGFEAKGKKLTFDELQNESLPLIAHMNNNHFIVVEKITVDKVLVFDIETKRQLLTHSGFREKWTGNTLCLHVKNDFVRLPAYLKKQQNTPSIKFETLFQDAGLIPEAQREVAYKYSFKNTGTADLKILKVKTNCGCAVGGFPQEPISPGDSGEISVVYTPGSQAGAFGKECAVVSNDPDFGIIKLYLAGRNEKELNYSPRRLDLGPVLYGQTETEECFVQYWGEAPLVLGQSHSEVEGLEVDIRKSSVNDFLKLHDNASLLQPHLLKNLLESTYTIRLKYSPAKNVAKLLKGTLIISTNLERRPTLEIPLKIKTYSTVRMTPSVLFFGEIWEEKSIEKEIVISSNDNQSIAIEAIDIGDTQLSYEIKELDNNKSCILFKGLVTNENKPFLIDSSIGISVKSSVDNLKIGVPVTSYLK